MISDMIDSKFMAMFIFSYALDPRINCKRSMYFTYDKYLFCCTICSGLDCTSVTSLFYYSASLLRASSIIYCSFLYSDISYKAVAMRQISRTRMATACYTLVGVSKMIMFAY